MFKENVRYYRNKARLSQEELARLVGCSQTLIAKFEIGSREPKATLLEILAKALNCTPNDLLLDASEEGKI